MTDTPTPDRAEAERFLNWLEPDGRFTFQTFADPKHLKGAKALTRILHGTLDDHWGALASLNAKGAGVFVTINETDLRGRSAENVIRVRALFVDLDDPALAPLALPKMEAAGMPPGCIVESSPGKLHVYWRVPDCPLEAFTPAQTRIIAAFGGDPAAKDLPRVMRLPGFIHQKGAPTVVRIKQIGHAA